MARQADAAHSTEDLFEDEILAAQAAEIEAVIAQAHGDARAAVGALLVQLGEAEAAVSLDYRRGVQPPRPVREA